MHFIGVCTLHCAVYHSSVKWEKAERNTKFTVTNTFICLLWWDIIKCGWKYSPNSAQILPRSLSPSVCQLKLWVCSECQEPQKSVWRLTHIHAVRRRKLSQRWNLLSFIFWWGSFSSGRVWKQKQREFFSSSWQSEDGLFSSLCNEFECLNAFSRYYMMSTWWVLFVILWQKDALYPVKYICTSQWSVHDAREFPH